MSRTHRRCAFTLIELLVVIALIMILAGLAVAFLPTIGENARVANGAGQLQQMLLTAKQKALRDRVPCGVRLLPFVDTVASGGTGRTLVTTCVYIEKPDDFPLTVGSTVTVAPTNLSQAIVSLALNGQVEVNDYLEVMGNGLMHRIIGINVTPAAITVLTLNSPMLYPLAATTQYRIVRLPRVTGDDVTTLPGNDPQNSQLLSLQSVVIDLSTNVNFNNTLPSLNADGSLDILFSPSGAVISQGVTTDTINLWVREYADVKANPIPVAGNGQQTILGVYVRSGLCAAHPPAPGANPYQYLQDGRTSGL